MKVRFFKDLAFDFFERPIKSSACFLLLFAYTTLVSFVAANHTKKAYIVRIFQANKYSSFLFLA